MGKRGPSKKPLELKLLDGSYRKDYDGDMHKQPRPGPAGNLEPPTDLGPVALRFWHRHYNMLKDLGLLTDPDIHLFVELCHAVQELDECNQYLKENGYYYTTDKGNFVRHPLATQRKDFVSEVHRLCARFGMTPGDRSGMQVDKPEPEKPVFQPLKRS